MAGCVYYPPSENLKIQTWYDLDAVRDNLAGNHTLMNDLDSTSPGYEELASPKANEGYGWRPIGMPGVSPAISFRGEFDGQGYEIRDLYTDRGSSAGLFGFVDYGGVIKDVGVMNVTAIGYRTAGSLVGENRGTVSNCHATGSVTGNEGVGGLVGYSRYGAVTNSYYNYDEVLINGENIITIGALFDEDFDQWLAHDKFLDVNERLSQENGYYLINDVSDFKQLLAFGQDGSLKFRSTNDLDLGDEPNSYIPYMAGEFDGNGHKISHLSFDFDFVSQVGLFGHLASGGTVNKVAAENVNITACEDVGGLVGYNQYGTVTNSYSTGSVTGAYHVGGLVGCNSYGGNITDSYCTGSVTGEDAVGGLVGLIQGGAVSNSYSTGSVMGMRQVGGLIGENDGTVSKSYSSGNVTSVGWDAGGLVGWNDGTVSNCYATGLVFGTDRVGGLVGRNNRGSVMDSYSTGRVNGPSYVGGLVGYNYEGTVSNSFWDIQTSGQATSDGGTGKTTAEMQDIDTFSAPGWNIIGVANLGTRNPSYIWNIVNGVTYPFLSWQS
jgi:hypothetical protein